MQARDGKLTLDKPGMSLLHKKHIVALSQGDYDHQFQSRGHKVITEESEQDGPALELETQTYTNAQLIDLSTGT